MERILPADRDWPLHGVAASRQVEQQALAGVEAHALMRRAGVAVAWGTVPGGTHFYSSASITADGRSVLDTVTAALKRWNCLP